MQSLLIQLIRSIFERLYYHADEMSAAEIETIVKLAEQLMWRLKIVAISNEDEE